MAFVLKLAFGDAVHCLFAEPTHSPCMLLGVHTGRHEELAVQDFGIDNRTAADGLAVGRPSGFVGKAMQRLIDGYYTVSDEELFRCLALLERSEGQPSRCSRRRGLDGSARGRLEAVAAAACLVDVRQPRQAGLRALQISHLPARAGPAARGRGRPAEGIC